MSISPTSYEQLLRPNPFAKKLPTQIVSPKKLLKKLLYEKATCKILVKMTPAVAKTTATSINDKQKAKAAVLVMAN